MTNEQQLLQRLQNGEASAFNEFVKQYRQQIYFFALDLTGNHHDADDLAQEVFIKAFRYIKNFRGDAKLSSWLYKIMVNAHIDRARKKSSKFLQFKGDLVSDDDSDFRDLQHQAAENPEKQLEANAIQSHINAALQGLSPRERSVFVLRHYNDLPLKQIGEILDIAEGTVKSLLFRAIKRLQKELAFYRPELGLEEKK